jgi:hypothetical protein
MGVGMGGGGTHNLAIRPREIDTGQRVGPTHTYMACFRCSATATSG